MIHEDLLIKKSPDLEKCLKPAFTEGQSLKVKLEEDRVAAFRNLRHLHLQWQC